VSVVPGAGTTSSATARTFTPTAAGTWCFSAIYSGDSIYNASADNIDAETADAQACVLVTSAPSTAASVTSADQITLGPSGTVKDLVTVTGVVGVGAPTGQVAFYACQTGTTQTLLPAPCTPGATPVDTENLAGGAGNTASTTSADFTPTAAGTWCFSAVYGGDTNYAGSSDNTAPANADASECVLVAKAPSTASGTVSVAGVTIGAGTVTDTLTVHGNGVGGAPTGHVQFFTCRVAATATLAPGPCVPSGGGDTEGLVAATSGTARATSAAFAPSLPGTWCFSAVYGGDTNYLGSSDDVSAGTADSTDCFFVHAPSVTTGMVSTSTIARGTGTVAESATVTGSAGGGSPTGSVTFYLCGPIASVGTCATSGTPTGSLPLVAAGSTSATASSPTASPAVPGTYCFAAVYQPDGSSLYVSSAVNVTGTPVAASCFTVTTPADFASADSAVASVNDPFTFAVLTEGMPATPIITKSGKVPRGLVLVDHHDGTAALQGTPAIGRGGHYLLTLKARFKVGRTTTIVTQAFTLGVLEPASVKGPHAAVAHIGVPVSITIRARGYPAATITETGTMPAGLQFTDNGNGTATIAGTATGPGGATTVSIGTTNGLGTPGAAPLRLVIRS
jgi:hypothetical protein